MNEGCSGLVLLSGASPSHLTGAVRNDTGIDWSVIDRCSVLIRGPGQLSPDDPLKCYEQGTSHNHVSV